MKWSSNLWLKSQIFIIFYAVCLNLIKCSEYSESLTSYVSNDQTESKHFFNLPFKRKGVAISYLTDTNECECEK